MSSIADWRKKFKEQSDAELLIEFVTQKSRAQLYLNPEAVLSSEEQNQLAQLFLEYQSGKPVAYLIGTQAFWTMDLIVTPDTLIPRSDTECVVRYIIENFEQKNLCVADLGTGSGAIAIALALENPSWIIHAADYSEKALLTAKQNADKYKAHNINFYRGNWCEALPETNYYDLIISNPPYISEKDPHLSALIFEPQSALVSGKEGLDDIKKIIIQSENYLKNNGEIILEHGFDQAESVLKLLTESQFQNTSSHRDLTGNFRFCVGVKK